MREDAVQAEIWKENYQNLRVFFGNGGRNDVASHCFGISL
jgi:hypothetical protein